MSRKKSRIERFFSLNQHRKRWGASRHADDKVDFEAMKSRPVSGDGDAVQTRGSEKSLDLHLDNLRREFVGQPEIVYHHAKLIVLIRREFRVDETFAAFRELWTREAEFLCANLNLRWLVSACDTFADNETDKAMRNAALIVSVMVNTVKIYESERHITNAEINSLDTGRIEMLQSELLPLFEGLSGFVVGTDDTLRNMRWRLDPVFQDGPIGLIFKTVYDRLQVNDTAFSRLRSLHHRQRTGWW